MKKLLTVYLAIHGLTSLASAQTAGIKGRIKDTLENKYIDKVVIALSSPRDSLLIGYIRSRQDGTFSMQQLPAGTFTMLISHPHYADYVDTVSLPENGLIDLGDIALTPRFRLLQEVVVRQKASAIRIRGDTTEFLADSFHLKPGANVEDLLRVLPGIRVNKKGEISAQGERIQKLLVDGEEFFSEDPTVATQNLKADMVDKVQVFDKKTDEELLTGITDDAAIKALNLQLKADKKKGWFGKAEAGTQFNRYYDNSAMFNAFKGKRKLSAFGQFSNTGKTGLNISENLQYGGGDRTVPDATEDNAAIDQLTGPGGTETGGIPENRSAGLHYSNTWNSDVHHVNGNYRYNLVKVSPLNTSLSQEILNNSSFVRSSQSSGFTAKERQQLSVVYDVSVDTLSTLQLSFKGGLTNTSNNSISTSGAWQNEKQVNSSERSVNVKAANKQWSGRAVWEKKFHRKGRSFYALANLLSTDNDAQGYLFAKNLFYGSTGNGTLSDTIDQRKAIVGKGTAIKSEFRYTEPIGENLVMSLQYNVSSGERKLGHFTYGKANGKYDQFIDSLSNDLDWRVVMQTVGINWQYEQQKITYTVGTDVTWLAYRQLDQLSKTSIKRRFANLLPAVNIQYKINNYKQFSLSYTSTLQQPGMLQLQPLRNNSDPLNIYIGNPNLRPACKHIVGWSMNDVKPSTNRFLNLGLSFAATVNDISNSSVTDPSGKRENQAINVNGNREANAFVFYTIQPGAWTASFYSSAAYSRNVNLVNYLNNVTNTWLYGVQPGIGWRHKMDKHQLNLRLGLYYNYSRSTINENLVTRYWMQEHTIEAGTTLPWKLQLSTDCVFSLRERLNAFDRNNNVIKWNAAITKRMFNDALAIKAQVNDILDQNMGFTRSVSANQVTERSYNAIRRYWLLGLTWNFNSNSLRK